MDINPFKIRIPSNLVLIKLDDDHNTYHSMEHGTDTGISVAPWGINQASHLALTGVVVNIPERLIYNGYLTAKLKRDQMRNDADQRRIADLRNESMAYDVPIELAVGYRVYFEYVTRLNAIKEGRVIENEQGKFILIPYDQLIMVFKPTTDFNNVQVSDVYLLNGFVLIKPLEYAREKTAEGIVGVKTESDLFLPVPDEAKYVHRNNMWYGTVLAAGCGVKSYADFPGRGGENESLPGDKPGSKIVYDGRHQKRLEVDHHRVIFKQHRLYRIQRKDIFGYYPDGNINGMPKV